MMAPASHSNASCQKASIQSGMQQLRCSLDQSWQDPVQSTSHVLSYLILTTALGGWYHYYTHFTGRQVEFRPRSHTELTEAGHEARPT